MDVMQPQFADEDPMNPFDFWEGADFKLKIRNVEGYRNYDKSEFAGQTALYGSDESKLEKVYGSLFLLNEFTDPTKYKTYEELQAKLQRVLGEPVSDMGAPTVKEEVQMNEPVAAEPLPNVTDVQPSSEDDGDTMSYFAKLAKEG